MLKRAFWVVFLIFGSVFANELEDLESDEVYFNQVKSDCRRLDKYPDLDYCERCFYVAVILIDSARNTEANAIFNKIHNSAPNSALGIVSSMISILFKRDIIHTMSAKEAKDSYDKQYNKLKNLCKNNDKLACFWVDSVKDIVMK